MALCLPPTDDNLPPLEDDLPPDRPELLLRPPDAEPPETPVELFLPAKVQNGHEIPNFIARCGNMYPAALK